MNKRTEKDLLDLTKNYILAVASRVGKTEGSDYVLYKVLPKLLVDCVGVDTVSFMDNPFAIGGKFTISVMREEFIKKRPKSTDFSGWFPPSSRAPNKVGPEGLTTR
jgi:hypothetical protein